MSNNKQKLELTWVGKSNPEYDIANIEPRILEERTDLSYGDRDTDNMIVHGDNLLALKALLPEYEGKVKCIYIDPPYNTGNAFEYYDDSVEHSTWLSLMKPRLELLKNLLKEDGVIVVQIDDKEGHYLKVLMDEIFGRINFITSIAVKSSTPSGLKTTHKDKTIIKTKDFILVYKKNEDLEINPQYTSRDEWDTHYSKFLDKDNETILNLIDILIEKGILKKGSSLKDLNAKDKNFKRFYIENKNNIFQTQPVMPEIHKQESLRASDKLYKYEANGEVNYAINGRRLVFLSNSLNLVEGGKEDLAVLLCDFWSDIDFQNTQNEGGVSFPASKKPEKLIYRILNMFTKKEDIILDSFLGSGTTAAVAHKMSRKYIGIEMGDHAYSHCKLRLDNIINGTDKSGISEIVDWKGGGGYKFYELAPSFVIIDEFGNPVIDPYYNDIKLIRAMCKLTNYTFAPSPADYWKHGKGQGNNSIYITTQMLSVAMVQQIASHLGTNETLLICPKKFEPGCENVDSRITIKKIPQSVLKACQFGKKEYLLPIKENAMEEIDQGDNSEEN